MADIASLDPVVAEHRARFLGLRLETPPAEALPRADAA